uniref:Uncharacterized protein n=1 Tax=Bracon brevicornis TaxID=1563983 RepID=A0A6V7KSY6_9HYME
MVRTESTKSDNSLEEHTFGRLFRDSHHRMPSPHLLPQQIGQRDSYRIVEVDSDTMHVIGDGEIQHLPEAVNREILKNGNDIVYEDDAREVELMREENFIRSVGARRALLKYPLLDEERRSLNGSRRNLNHKAHAHVDDDKRSLNGSRRNLSGSRKYILVPVDKPDCWNGSAKNLNVGSRENLMGSRRHTGSKEHLNAMKRNSIKTNKEQLLNDNRHKRNHPIGCSNTHVDIENEKQRRIINHTDSIRQSCTTNSSPSSDSIIGNNDIIVTIPNEPILTPESGFAESPHSGSSPDSIRREIKLPCNSVISKNRRSYESAQLQDVNHAMIRTSSASSTSDSDATAKDSVGIVSGKKKQENQVKQTISHTSV